ncbi:RNA recognition motif protein [Ceratobasidium sp. AG-Ba]|nr:RNA recognition motif protein [Ceratobasidium sp. AG-Ba]
MLLTHDLTHGTDYRVHAPAAERELHVVLPEPWMDTPYVLQMATPKAGTWPTPEGVSWVGAGAGARVQAHWAGAVGRANEEEYVAARPGPHTAPGVGPNAGKQLEFSIFVGDLAPETTNADLVAVFRNPLLGLRPDREPRVIRPFASCRSAKIMVNPETGISKGYGFVRFTDEADQQRALIEMQGLYCLSRPMRLSHATAKTKPITSSVPNGTGAFHHYPTDERDSYETSSPGSGPAPDAAFFSNTSPSRPRSIDAEELFNAEMGGAGRVLGVEGGRVLGVEGSRGGGGLSDGARLESARALLGALNSADPYNTTGLLGD